MRSQRIDKEIEYIISHKKVSLDQLCDMFRVSKNTIRRDILEILEDENFHKIYGGIEYADEKKLVSFGDRHIKNAEIKAEIAKKAAQFVQSGDIIFLDSGTTTCHMVDYIKDLDNVTLLTNNIDAILRAVPYPNLNVICLSGSLNRKAFSFTGPSSELVLQGYNVQKAFLASTGISIERGVCNTSSSEFGIKKAVVSSSPKKYLLVDESKFGVVSLHTYCQLSDIDQIITNAPAPKPIEDYLSSHGIPLYFSQDQAAL